MNIILLTRHIIQVNIHIHINNNMYYQFFFCYFPDMNHIICVLIINNGLYCGMYLCYSCTRI